VGPLVSDQRLNLFGFFSSWIKTHQATALIDGFREKAIRNAPPPHCGPHTALTHLLVVGTVGWVDQICFCCVQQEGRKEETEFKL